MSQKVCKAGHPLKCELDAPTEGRKRVHKKLLCDECKRIAVVAEFLGCRECNYDVCTKCLKKADIARHDMQHLLGPSLYTQDKQKKDTADIAGKTIAVYFWSHTCDICDEYSKALARFYTEMKAKVGDSFEIIAVTDIADDCDEDEPLMWSSYQKRHGNWPTVPFDCEAARHRLHDWAEELTGDDPSGSGPSLIVVDKHGHLVNQRAFLTPGSGADMAAKLSFRSPRVGDLSCGPYAADLDLGCSKALVLLLERCSQAVISNVRKVVTEAGPKLLQKGVITFVTGRSGVCPGRRRDVEEALASGCRAWGRGWSARALRAWSAGANAPRVDTPDTVPLMLLLDVSEFTDEDAQGVYVSDATLITPEKILSFVGDVLEDRATRHPLDYSLFTEDYKPIPSDEVAGPAYQPLTGSVTAKGNFVGAVGGWDGFGIEGITGEFQFDEPAENAKEDEEEGADDSSSSGGDPEGGILAQVRSGGQEDICDVDAQQLSPLAKRPSVASVMKGLTHEELCDAVGQLQETVSAQQHVIQQLLRRVAAIDGKKEVSVVGPSPEARERSTLPATPAPGSEKKGVWHDDDDTDSDDSEVREYRAKQAAKKAGGGGVAPAAAAAAAQPAPAGAGAGEKKWKSEDDSNTDSDDSEVREYRAKQAAKKAGGGGVVPAAAAPAAAAAAATEEVAKRNEDDDDTDSDDSEVREYRAKQAAKKAGGGGVAPAAAPAAADTAAAAGAGGDDWHCGTCHEFNWGDALACVHCSRKR